MDRLLIDVVLDVWKRQDDSGVPRWAVFPCSLNKLPIYRKGEEFGDGHNSATTDEETARRLFGMTSVKKNRIGVAGGEVSGGVFAFDIDIKKSDTPEPFKDPDNVEFAIENVFGELPKTADQKSMSGGRQKIYIDKDINSLNDAFDFKTTGLSIDIKGNGGYFILYDYDMDFENISDAPKWIKEHLKEKRKEKNKEPINFSEKFSEGNRNSGLTAIAGKFYNYGDSPEILSAFLHGYNFLNCIPPLPAKDVDRIVKSAVDNFSRDYEKTDIGQLPDDEDDFNCLADFCVPVEDQSFLIPDMITESSLTIFTGIAGSGKTWVTTDICLSVALGVEWMGKQTLKKNVLIVDEESGKDRLKRRMRKLVAGRGLMEMGKEKFLNHDSEIGQLPFKGRTFRRTDISDKKFVKKYKEKIIKDNIGLILFDALVDITPGKDENNPKEMLPALLNLKQLCEETKVSIIVIHHAGKAEGSTSRGTSAIEGAVDGMFNISQNKDSGVIKIKSTKERDIQKIEFNAELKYSDFTVVLEKTDKEYTGKLERKFSNLKLDILKLLYEKQDWIKIKDICMEIKGYEEKNIKKQIEELLTMDLVEKELLDGIAKNGNIWRVNSEKSSDIHVIITNGYSK